MILHTSPYSIPKCYSVVSYHQDQFAWGSPLQTLHTTGIAVAAENLCDTLLKLQGYICPSTASLLSVCSWAEEIVLSF